MGERASRAACRDLGHMIAANRPRERLWAYGHDQASDADLIAVVLGTGVRGKTAVHLAHEALAVAGGMVELSRASPRELSQLSGVGPARAARLAAAFALGFRVVTRSAAIAGVVTCAADVYRRVWPRLAGVAQEVFLVLAVDVHNTVLGEIEVARGCLTGVEVHPREVFRPLIRMAAAGLIAVHNHPSGDPTPSCEDINLTRRLRAVGELLGIPMIDHVIVAARGFTSMAECLADDAEPVPAAEPRAAADLEAAAVAAGAAFGACGTDRCPCRRPAALSSGADP